MKRRIVNFRCFLITFIYIVLTILLALLQTRYKALGIVLLVCLSASAIGLIIFTMISSAKRILPVTFALCFVVMTLTNINFINTNSAWVNKDIDGSDAYVCGAIDGIIQVNDKNESILLTDLQIDGVKYDGIMRVYIDGKEILSNISVGYNMVFTAKTYAIPLIDNMEVNGVTYRKNLRYKSYAKASDVTFTVARMSFLDRITQTVHDTLTYNMGHHNGDIAFSMLTGDKNNLDYSIVNYFSLSGLGHIMAVSGLHVGFLVLLLSFILRKLKFNKVFSFIIVTIFLFAYAFLVGFSPSVMRAVIMCLVGLATTINGRRKDALSSLMLASSLILTISPFYLFEVGFLLSFFAVFGLILFASPFEKFFRAIHIPRFIASPLGVSAAAQLGIIPAMAYYFNQLQVYSVFVNLLVIPIIMVTFNAIVVSLVLALIFPFFGILLKISGIGMAFVDGIAYGVSLLPYNNVVIFSFIGVFGIYILYFILSRFTMIPKVKKYVNIAVSAICIALIVMPSFFIQRELALQNVIVPINSSKDVTSLIVGSSIDVVGDFKNAKAVRARLVKNNIRRVNRILLFSLDDNVASQIVSLEQVIDIDAIYCPSSAIRGGVDLLVENKIKNFYAFDAVPLSDYSCVEVNGKVKAYVYTNDKVSILLSAYSSDYTTFPTEIINSAQIIRSYLYMNVFPERVYLTNLPRGFMGENPRYEYSLSENEYAFKYFDGIVYK